MNLSRWLSNYNSASFTLLIIKNDKGVHFSEGIGNTIKAHKFEEQM